MPRLLLLLIVTLAAGALLAESMPSRQAQAAFPGANGKIAFERGPIWIMRPDGSSQVNLTPGMGGSDPAWSPDGSYIAFVGFTGGQDRDQVYVMEADGSAVTPLTDTGFGKAGPTWSPDGTRVAFAAHSGTGYYDIFAVNSDGSDLRQLTTENGNDASWSPDGARIVFRSTRLAGPGLYTMDANGDNEMPLTTDPTDKEPSWSPDMSRIVFVRRVLTPDGFPEPQIHVMDSDGSEIVQLTSHDSVNARRESPDWSPDGTQIVYEDGSRGSDEHEVYVMNADGTNQQNISNSPYNDASPAWQPLLSGESMPGDVNCGGDANAVDASLVLQMTAGLLQSLLCPDNGDVNSDGLANSLDALLILQYSAGLLDHL